MIDIQTHRGVALVRLGHGSVNALDLELVRAVADTFAQLAREGRAVVLTGSGSCFSAGVDLRRVTRGGAPYLRRFLPALSDAFLAVFDHPYPTVAAVNGHAIAGGFVLAAACDHRVAATGDHRLGLTELAVGVPFPIAALEIVRYAVGDAVAGRLVLDAELRSVTEAHRAGLVHELVPPDDLVTVAVDRAGTRAGYPSQAFALTKSHLVRPTRERIRANRPTDDEAVLAAWTRDETLERIGAFVADLGDGNR